MADAFVIIARDPENSKLVLKVVDAAGARVAGTAQISLDLTLLTGTDKDMEPREIQYLDADCNPKRRWVLCTAEESVP